MDPVGAPLDLARIANDWPCNARLPHFLPMTRRVIMSRPQLSLETFGMSLQAKLYQLFLLDQHVRGLSTRLNAARARQKAQQAKLDQLSQQQRELSEQFKQVAAKAANLEREANDVETRIGLIRTRMNSVTSNKEYSAMLVEVSTIKIEKTKKEDEAIKQMEERERVGSQVKDVEAKIEEQRKLVAGAEKEVGDRLSEVGQKLDEVTKQRDAAAAELPENAMAQFKRAANTHDGDALASVVEEDRRYHEYSCGGCYMGLPAERVNSLMTKRDDIICCPSCGRILYVGDELKSSLAASK